MYNHVFRFGKPSDETKRTIGIYGVGLKRAIFKIGENILIESDDGKDFFSVLIDKKWLYDEQNWKLKFKSEEKSRGNPLTRITITEIFPHIGEEMASTRFENTLIERIKDTYSVFIEDRVTIEVKDKPVEPYDFRFLFDKKKGFVPFHKKYNFDGVDVEIYAGYTPVSREWHPYGWYVFCNDRLIIRSDTSDRTGWGGGGKKDRKYHYPQDNWILGIILFGSENPMLLPWQTTKDDIQDDLKVYRKAQIEMKTITGKFTDVIRIAYETRDPETRETIGTTIFEDVQTRSRREIKEELEEVVPEIKGELGQEAIRNIPEIAYIQYPEKINLIKKVKKKLGNSYMSNKEVGKKTFKYYVDMEGVKDE